jgi:hypothetical protein
VFTCRRIHYHCKLLPSLYQRSASARAPLRVGLLLDSKTLPRCFSEVVDHILQSIWDRRHIVPTTDPEAQVVDCTARLANIESISVDPIGKRFVHRFPADAIDLIRNKTLDDGCVCHFPPGVCAAQVARRSHVRFLAYATLNPLSSNCSVSTFIGSVSK